MQMKFLVPAAEDLVYPSWLDQSIISILQEFSSIKEIFVL